VRTVRWRTVLCSVVEGRSALMMLKHRSQF
jgi:hypothetical protein